MPAATNTVQYLMGDELVVLSGQRWALVTIAAAVFTMLASLALCSPIAASPIGVWETPDGASQIEIKKCGTSLCGTIVWLSDPHDRSGGEARDSKNPDPRLRARPLVGLPLLHGLIQDPSNREVWRGGEIYDPSDGKTYSCRITVESPTALRIRGFVGLPIFGVAQVWHRVK